MREDAPNATTTCGSSSMDCASSLARGSSGAACPTISRPGTRSTSKPVAGEADVFSAIIADLRALIRIGEGRSAQPSAMILDSRTVQSTPESGDRAGWDGAKRRKGSKVHLAVDTFGHLLALHVTPANAQDRAQVAELTTAVQEATRETVTLA